MQYDIATLTDRIIQSPLFLQLKTVVEYDQYHNNEDVYNHSIKTSNIAKKETEGLFVTNVEAKLRFTRFMDEIIAGMKRRDALILAALLHDIGKILYYKEEGKLHPLKILTPDQQTQCPGHEYYGSVILKEAVKDLGIPAEVIAYIANIVRLHDTFNASYFKEKNFWAMSTILEDVKARAEGLYKETLFNIYCDYYTEKQFEEAKGIIVKLFNNPLLYISREYYIP